MARSFLGRRSTWWLKLGVRALQLVVLAWPVYLLLSNIFLSTPLLRALLDRHPAKFDAEYVSASSWWPGRIEVKGLRVRGRDASLEWLVTADVVRFNVSFTELTHRTFHASHVRGDGIAVRVRPRLLVDKATPERAGRFPEIGGFLDPPIRELAESPPHMKYKLWTVRLEDVDAENVREIWIDDYRFEGLAKATGGFTLEPLRRVVVDPANVTILEGGAFTGQDPIVIRLGGAIRGALEPFDMRKEESAAMLHYITAEVKLAGHLEDLRWARHYFHGATLGGGEGTADSDVSIDHGTLKVGSRARLEMARATVAVAGYHASTDARVDFDVALASGAPRATLAVGLGALAFEDERVKGAEVRAKSSAVALKSAELDLAAPFGDLAMSLDMPRADITDVRIFNPYLHGDDFTMESGTAALRVHADGSLPAHGGSAEIVLQTDRTQQRFQKAHFTSRATFGVRVDHADFSAHTMDLSGSYADLKEVSILGEPNTDSWWGRVDLNRTHVRLEPATVATDAYVKCRDARPILYFFAKNAELPVWMRGALSVIPSGAVGSATTAVNGTAQLKFADELVKVHALHATAGIVEFRAELSKQGEHKQGALLVKSGPLAAGIELRDEGSSVKLIAAEDWYRSAEGAASAIR